MSGPNRATIARLAGNEAEVTDNLHTAVEDIIRVTSPRRFAAPLEVSGDALARARGNVRHEVAS